MHARHLLLVAPVAASMVWALATSAAVAQRPEHSNRSGQRPSHGYQAHPQHSVPSVGPHTPMRPTYPSFHSRPAPPPQEFHWRGDYSYRSYRHPIPEVYSRPLFVYPQVAYDPVLIRIVNPVGTGVAMSYALDGQVYFLNPGDVQWLERPCVVTFDSGYGGVVRMVLTRGTYVFTPDASGAWTLRRT